jgi:hypothetical protein
MMAPKKHPAIKILTTAFFRFMASPPLGKCIDCFLAPEVQSERGPQTTTPTGTIAAERTDEIPPPHAIPR